MESPPTPPEQTIATAYWALEEALVEIEHPHHKVCGRDREPTAHRFYHPVDQRVVIVWSDKPHCLIVEMEARGCHYDGVSSYNWARLGKRFLCPPNPKEMPW